MKYTEKNVLVGIAGRGAQTLLDKIKEINRRQIAQAGLFLTQVNKSERRRVYQALLKSTIKEIPLIHLRNDMSGEEVRFLKDNFHPTYYTIHKSSFRYLYKWSGFKKKLYLEFSGRLGKVPPFRLDTIGGFCVDLAHYKIGETCQSDEFKYQLARRKNKKLFACNHLNGYDPRINNCNHLPKADRDFAYLKTLPRHIFSPLIALEMENPIKEQLAWRKKILKLLHQKFS